MTTAYDEMLSDDNRRLRRMIADQWLTIKLIRRLFLQFRHWLRFWGAGTGGDGKIVVVAITRVSYRAESGQRGKVVFEAGRIL